MQIPFYGAFQNTASLRKRVYSRKVTGTLTLGNETRGAAVQNLQRSTGSYRAALKNDAANRERALSNQK
jgi:hypothetical protein